MAETLDENSWQANTGNKIKLFCVLGDVALVI